MNQTHHSPVSPIELTSFPINPSSPASTQLPVAVANNRSSIVRSGSWLPSTLRWYFLLIPAITSLVFGIALALLVWYSQRNNGIGADNGTSIILFGWRFTPTLFAVLYTQMTVILFEDAKRTEPFARLARAPVEGAPAYGTVLQTPRAWWSIFGDVVFKRKKLGRTSWCLLLTALINTLALIAISPLSSALLTSEEVSVFRPVEFSRVATKDGAQLSLTADRETYFRTTSALMRNISTSAWITDKTLTLPFWPSSEEVQVGPQITSNVNTWTAESTILHADLECQNMKLESAGLVPKQYMAYDVLGHGPYHGTESMVVFVLKSGDGCRYELSLHPLVDIAFNGGATWSKSSTYFLTDSGALPIGGMPIAPNVSATTPYARVDASKDCRDRDLILVSTPWTSSFEMDWSQGPMVRLNRTYQRSPDFRMNAQLCESRYTMETQNITATMVPGRDTDVTTSSGVTNNRHLLNETLVDTQSFQTMAMQSQWLDYFDKISAATDADNALGGSLRPDANLNTRQSIPGFSGMAPLLASLYAFNLTAMLDDSRFAEQAARVKSRFFTECLRNSLTDQRVVTKATTRGRTSAVEERILVLREIGITLSALFLASCVLLFLVLCTSRLKFRPLNLCTDPSSTVGLSILLRSQRAQGSIFRSLHLAPRQEFHRALRSETFYSMDGSLHTGSGCSRSSTVNPGTKVSTKRWQPLPIRLRMLFALSSLLTLVAVAILIMNTFSTRSRLHQLAFIYEADVSKLGLSFSTFAPISIAPTVISIAIGLWWDQLDSTFRILQPYIAMSRQPTPIRHGAGLTYRSKTWAGAAIKAARNKHWLLFMIALGSVFCQLLTVSMSALFERQATNVSRSMTLKRTLETRQMPIATEIRTVSSSRFSHYFQEDPSRVLDTLLSNPPQNWLSGAAIQLSLNGTSLPWTSDGWSFLPLDLSLVPDASSIQKPAGADSEKSFFHPTNVTFRTSALRARLECDTVPEIGNPSSWLVHPKKFNANPSVQYNFTGVQDYYLLNGTIFNGSPSNTSAFVDANEIMCCANGTAKDPQRAAIGYWSPTEPRLSSYTRGQWPFPFVTKWIVGKPQVLKDVSLGHTQLLVYKEIPSMQAARCVPIIESAEMTIVVDKVTNIIHSYEMQGTTSVAESAWSEAYVRHDISNETVHYNASYLGPLNITTSYGIMFLDAMFRAADRNGDFTELLGDQSFVMRDLQNGLNMDMMTHSMYSLANKDPEALLNYTNLVQHADKTFQTFFQHFVNNGLSLTQGGLAYQKINDRSLDALGPPVNTNGSALPRRQFTTLNTNRTVGASVSNQIQVLHMNPVATYLSIGILIWLVGTTAIVTCFQRKYTSSMIHDVQLIADVLVLVAGSDNLLRLVEDKGIELKGSRDVKTMLGWFKGADGEVRWGVEVVGGNNAVDWVDAPKHGWHVRPNNSSVAKILSWRPWKKP